jgi:hypothetical protein
VCHRSVLVLLDLLIPGTFGVLNAVRCGSCWIFVLGVGNMELFACIFGCTGERWCLSTHLFNPFLLGACFDLLYVDVSLNCLSSFKCIMVSDVSMWHLCSICNFYVKF